MDASSTSRRLVVPACFLLSGASALVYETVWLRQILLVVGTTTGAVSTVLGVFMLGLGLGALWIGARADRVRSPLRLYAFLELGIGVYALLLPAIVSVATPLYVGLARSAAGSPGLLTALRVVFGFALLLAPTLMMGATLPVLLRFAQRGGGRFGRDLGNLYALNLAGAAVGSILTGFVLIRVLGVSGAARVAVVINLGVALVAWIASRRPHEESPDDHGEPVSASAVSPGVRAALWATVFASGFATMGFEVLWARILVFSFQSTVYAFTVILSTFLVGLALGSALYARLETRLPALTVLAYGQLLAGVSALLLAPVAGRPAALLESFSQSLGKSGGTWVLGMALVSSLAMLIPATLMGTVFPLGTRLLVTDLRQTGHRVGMAYLVNTVGCVVGSLGTGFVLIPALGLKGCLVAICVLQAGLGVLFARRPLAAAAGLAAVVLAAFGTLRSLAGPSPFDGHLPAGSSVLAHHDDPGASVSVVRYPNDHRGLRIDGFDASTDTAASGYMAMMTHIPMLLHPDPKQLLVICFGTGRTAGSGLLYPGARIDVVDVNPGVFGFEALFRDANRGVAQSPRARLVLDDGRNFLLTSRDRYDVITSEPMPPRFAGVVNLYTREYYELARDHLAPGGLVVQWLPVHLMSVQESLNVLRTVMEVFPETSLWIHRATGIIVSSRDPIQKIDVGALAARMSEPALKADLAGLQVDGVRSFVKLYTLDPATLARLTAGARPVTDDRPSLEFHEVSHRRPELVGTHWSDAAQALEILLRARTETQVPLAGAEDAVIADLRDDHAAASFAVLGDLYLELQRPDQAKLQYLAGAERARRPRDRALFLFVLGDMAAAAGSTDEARRLLDAGLALWPDNVRAKELRQKLAGG